jgi:hypothetical protein
LKQERRLTGAAVTMLLLAEAASMRALTPVTWVTTKTWVPLIRAGIRLETQAITSLD